MFYFAKDSLSNKLIAIISLQWLHEEAILDLTIHSEAQYDLTVQMQRLVLVFT